MTTPVPRTAPASAPPASPAPPAAPSALLARFFALAAHPAGFVDDAAGRTPFPRLVARATSVAHALVDAHGGPLDGARVALLAAPSAAFVEGLFGVLAAGGVGVVLSPLHPAAESRYFCEDARVTRILCDAAHATLLPDGLAAPTTLLETFAARAAEPRPLPEVPSPSPALQLYTSGTTGKPKGAVLGHAALAVQQGLLAEAWAMTPGDVLLHALPLHHMHGLAIALLNALGAGASVRFAPFDARRLWDTFADATVFMGVPTMYHRLFEAHDAASDDERARFRDGARGLRLATSGSAALPVPLAERWRALTGDVPLERFGMTEIGVGLANPLAGPRRAGCVGAPLPTVATRIVGDDGRDAEVGELWIRGPSLFLGYHGRADATQEAFAAADPADPDPSPWFRTGDTVTRDAAFPERPFRILGRTSVDILKSGGYKLSALEIEDVLRGHPAVGEVAVVGVPDPRWGDRVVACVVRPAGARATPDDAADADGVRAHARAHLAPYKVPKEVRFFDALPRNAVGKVQKRALVAELVAADAPRDV